MDCQKIPLFPVSPNVLCINQNAVTPLELSLDQQILALPNTAETPSAPPLTPSSNLTRIDSQNQFYHDGHTTDRIVPQIELHSYYKSVPISYNWKPSSIIYPVEEHQQHFQQDILSNEDDVLHSQPHIFRNTQPAERQIGDAFKFPTTGIPQFAQPNRGANDLQSFPVMFDANNNEPEAIIRQPRANKMMLDDSCEIGNAETVTEMSKKSLEAHGEEQYIPEEDCCGCFCKLFNSCIG